MANKRFYQFLYSKVPMLTKLNCLVTFGSSGAVSTVAGAGIYGVTKLFTGIYEIKLKDNYNAIVGYSSSMFSGTTGSNVADGSFVANTLYQITAVGTTDWAAIGLDSDFTAAVGMLFVATGAGGAGTGTAKAIGLSGILNAEIAQSQSAMLQNNNSGSGKGSVFIIQTLDAAGAAASPASGSELHLDIWLKNSSVLAV